MPYSSKIKARKLNAWSAQPDADYIWTYSKRELVEIALHLAAQLAESYDTALETGDAARRVMREADALARAKLI